MNKIDKINVILLLACLLTIGSIFAMDRRTDINAIKAKILSFARSPQEYNRVSAILSNINTLDELNARLNHNSVISAHISHVESQYDYPHQGD